MEIKLVKKSDSPYGLDALMSLSYSAATKSELPFADKRKLIFSLYSLRCLFDNNDLLDPPAILVKFGCCALVDPLLYPPFTSDGQYYQGAMCQTDAVYLEDGAILIDYQGQKKLKADAGGRLYDYLVLKGMILGELAAYPQKYELLQTVDVLLEAISKTGNSTDDAVLLGDAIELKVLWFVLFPFLFSDAPDSGSYLAGIKEKLLTPSVYRAALASDYAAAVLSNIAEVFTDRPFVLDWFKGYDLYKSSVAAEGGQSGKAAENNNMIFASKPPIGSLSKPDDALSDALMSAQQLFSQNPKDEGALLLLLAARTNQPEDFQTESLLKENISLITQFLPQSNNKAILAYYMGLSFLGLGKLDKAVRALEIALQLQPDFTPAVSMLAALKNNFND